MANYDVFLSFKCTDATTNTITEDTGIAEAIHAKLSSIGIPTFYCRKSLEEENSARFKDSIIDALDSAKVLILVATKPEYITARWVKYEWNGFETQILNGKNGYIIPYLLCDNIPINSRPSQINAYDAYDISTLDIDGLAKKVVKRLKASDSETAVSVSTQNNDAMLLFSNIRNESMYSSTYKDENSRLNMQADNTRDIDLKYLEIIYQEIGRLNLTVLDVGCALGYVADSRFGHEKRVGKIICIDKNQECIEKAKTLRYTSNNDCNDRQVFYNYSMSHDTDEEFKDILQENGIDKVDVIFVSMTAHHWSDPIETFEKLRKYLRDDGYLYIRTCDDGSIIASPPDANNILAEIIRRCSTTPGMSDRAHGRKVCEQLKKSGFDNVRMFVESRNTSVLDHDKKMDFFREKHKFRLNFFEQIKEEAPADSTAVENYRWMETNIRYLQDAFRDPNFWYCESEFICIAKKK